MRFVKLTLVMAWACSSMLLMASVAAGQADRRGLVELALDEPTNVTLENIRLEEAVQVLSERTGVRIFMPPEVMELAPYGADTVVQRIEIKNTSLRQGLTDLLSPLGMTFQVEDDHVSVQPVEALRCLGRAPTWTELDTLAELSTMQPGIKDADLERLRAQLQFQVPVPEGWTTLAAAIRSVGVGPGDEVLSVACAKLGWGWCLSDRHITVSSGATQIRRKLQQPISLRMNFRPLIDVLQEFGRVAGVAVRTEPGSLASLPLQVQKNFSLNAHEVPAEQVLESLAAHTGLGYLVEPDGILFYRMVEAPLSDAEGTDQSPLPSDSDPYVGKIVIPLGDGRSVEWFIRRSELPPDLRQMRTKDLREAFEAIRTQSRDEGP